MDEFLIVGDYYYHDLEHTWSSKGNSKKILFKSVTGMYILQTMCHVLTCPSGMEYIPFGFIDLTNR